MLDYLGRYTRRVAINNYRIKNISDDGTVTFTVRNRKKNKTYPVVLESFEFTRRFLLHILPSGFMKIRFYGFLSHTNKKQALALIRKSLNQQPPAAPTEDELKETAAEKILRLTGLDIAHCPKCGEKLVQTSLPLPDWVLQEIENRAKSPP